MEWVINPFWGLVGAVTSFTFWVFITLRVIAWVVMVFVQGWVVKRITFTLSGKIKILDYFYIKEMD